MYLNILKAIYDKLTDNILLRDEMLKAFLLKSGTRQGWPLSPLLLNVVLESLVIAIIQKINKYPNWQGSSNFLYADDMILYTENSKDPHTKTTRTDKEIQQSSSIQDKHTEICAFLYTKNEIEKEGKKKKL